jgi:lipoate-protein ligase A
MRLPRHDTPLSLPAEPPDAGLRADEALLARAASWTAHTPAAEHSDRPIRLWTARSPAVVVGVGLHHRLDAIVDTRRCQRDGVQVLKRSAGGGALLLDEHTLCGAIAIPGSKLATTDVTESYRWLADLLLAALAIPQARRVAVAEARQDIASLRQRHDDPVSQALLTTCYGALSPHEIVVDDQKLVGLAQVRRRDAVLFQFGILLRDQAPLADYLDVPNTHVREALRAALAARTIGLTAVTDRPASVVAAAIADAMPCVP